MKRLGWATQYYDAVEYYFWGPDKLNARRDPARACGADVVLDRLKRLEEPLNHLLTLFLELSPSDLRRDLTRRCADLDIGAGSAVGDRATHGLSGPINVVQPDALLTGPAGTLAFEVKLGAKSDYAQVLKYALLLSRLSPDRPFALTYLTAKPFAWHWSSGDTPEAVKSAAAEHLEGLDRIGRLPLDDTLKSELADALAKLQLTAWGFPELAQFLEGWSAKPIETPGDETLKKLCLGLLSELQARGLAGD